MDSKNLSVYEDVSSQLQQAIKESGLSEAKADPGNPATLYVVLRSRYSSRTFMAIVLITEAREV